MLVFDRRLYHNRVPDQPGGGTVLWTNPWHEHSFIDDIEIREDGGTPAFLQAIKAALAVRVKDAMGVERMLAREHEMVPPILEALQRVPRLHVLAGHVEERLGIFSFYVEHLHYNLVVRLLSDRFGVQVRGGCSCAGTYGHYLLHVDPKRSRRITEKIDHGDLSEKPGWVRMSIHPTTPDAEVEYLLGGGGRRGAPRRALGVGLRLLPADQRVPSPAAPAPRRRGRAGLVHAVAGSDRRTCRASCAVRRARGVDRRVHPLRRAARAAAGPTHITGAHEARSTRHEARTKPQAFPYMTAVGGAGSSGAPALETGTKIR